MPKRQCIVHICTCINAFAYMVTCILPIQCIVECKHRCKSCFAHGLVSSASAKMCKFPRIVQKTQATSQFCFHMPQLDWPVPIFHQSTKRSVSKVIFRCADIMPVHLHICLIASALVYASAYPCVWSFAYICTCLKAFSLAGASIHLWPITCNSGYLIDRYMTTWFIKVMFKPCY